VGNFQYHRDHDKNNSNHVEGASSMALPTRAEDPMHAADKITALVSAEPYTWLMDAEGRKAKGEVLTAYAAKKFAEQDQLSRYYTVSMVSATNGYVTATRGARHREHVLIRRPVPVQDGLPPRHSRSKTPGLIAPREFARLVRQLLPSRLVSGHVHPVPLH
jgi:hypothetical protein